MNKNITEGIWRLADPKISITSAAAMMIGIPVAARDTEISWLWLLVTAFALFAMEVAKNAWGDVFDYDSGTDLAVKPEDRTDFSGGKRVLVDNLLTRQQTWLVAYISGATGLMAGILIVWLQAPMAFWIGIIGLLLGWSYHGPPLQLAYRGLGELDVVVCYGPLICTAAYTIQTNTLSLDVLLLSMPLGLFIAAFLWVNEFPDHDADKTHGKHNLVVTLGKFRASRLLPLIYLMGFGCLLVLPWATHLNMAIYAGLIAVLPAIPVVIWTWQNPTSFYRKKPVQPLALLTFVLYSIGTGSGILVSS